MKLLVGHVSEETAKIVEDYPYGFVLRCRIRYWIEHRKGMGFRFCSQTLNPKSGKWNSPKRGIYVPLAIMTEEEPEDNNPGYISYISLPSGLEPAERWLELWKPHLPEGDELVTKTFSSWENAVASYRIAREKKEKELNGG